MDSLFNILVYSYNNQLFVIDTNQNDKNIFNYTDTSQINDLSFVAPYVMIATNN